MGIELHVFGSGAKQVTGYTIMDTTTAVRILSVVILIRRYEHIIHLRGCDVAGLQMT